MDGWGPKREAREAAYQGCRKEELQAKKEVPGTSTKRP
jgi:hypothetical protein